MTAMPAGVVAIVDTYRPTRGLALKFAEIGWTCVRVQSTPEVPTVYRAASLNWDAYADNIVHHGDLEETARAVAKHKPDLVIAGGELGVELADALSETLGLLTNGIELSSARRHKYEQIEAVRRAGLTVAQQFTSADRDAVVDWHRRTGGRVVVKPVRSAAGDGVHFCDAPEDTAAAADAVLAAENVFSQPNEAVVAQEYVIGTEYVVDTVSRDGRHRVTDIWSYEKLAVNGVRDLIGGYRLLPRRGPAQEELVPYVEAVLDALGIRHGPAHVEVKLTPSGPCLIEVGARLAGLSIPYLTPAAIGDSQIDWTVLAYTDPEAFRDRFQEDYRIERHITSVCLVSPADGTVLEYPSQAEIEGLESLYSLQVNVPVGGRVRRTVDDNGWPMVVTLMHPVAEIVHRDATTVRYLDGPAFYRIAGDAG